MYNRLYGHNYKGYFTNNKDKNTQNRTRYDMRIAKFGLIGQYFFNNNRFSPRAAFNQSERQKKSAGSLIVGGGFYITRISADSIEIINESTRKTNFHIAPSVGYAYSFIFKRNFHITASLSLAADLEIKNPKGKVDLNPIIMPRLSGGYNVDKWGLNLSYDGNRMYLLLSSKDRVALRSGVTQLTYTRRFNYRPKLFEKISNWLERKHLVNEDV
ncbi:MAG: DUF4421 domain-containing protein [Odoribacter sp.]|nr:DUF4421 domain-containing protein [Odoribacter sp.]